MEEYCKFCHSDNISLDRIKPYWIEIFCHACNRSTEFFEGFGDVLERSENLHREDR